MLSKFCEETIKIKKYSKSGVRKYHKKEKSIFNLFKNISTYIILENKSNTHTEYCNKALSFNKVLKRNFITD